MARWLAQNVQKQERAIKKFYGDGILSFTADTGLELFISKGIPYLAQKGGEAGWYYASEAMRNPKLQKKAIDYALENATPIIQKVGSEALDQLSTKVRPDIKYKTDRMDLDSDLYKGEWLPIPFPFVDWKKGWDVLTAPGVFTPAKVSAKEGRALVAEYKRQYKDYKDKGGSRSYGSWIKWKGYGGGLDIHKAIGKLPRPKSGFTPCKYKYMGPYNPLDKQLEYDKNTGQVTKWHVQPYNKVDEIAA